jgi:hypothetical protein
MMIVASLVSALIFCVLGFPTHFAAAMELPQVSECPLFESNSCETLTGRLHFTSMTNHYLRLSTPKSNRLRIVREAVGDTEGLDELKGVQLGYEAIGIFTVCPLERAQPKKAQSVCLAAATGVRIEREKP